MPDRIIRDELLESERWLDLPTDTDRLAYFGLRIRSDDFGNMEAGPRKLYRLLHGFTQIKTEESATVTLTHLADADLIRFYKAGTPEREFIHLPRSRPTGSYLVRKCPPSPWCDADTKLGKHVRAIRNQGLAKNLPDTSQSRYRDVPQGTGIGVGIGIGTGKEKKKAHAPVDNSRNKVKTDDKRFQFKTESQWAKHLGLIPRPGEQWTDFSSRVRTEIEQRAAAGDNIARSYLGFTGIPADKA